jgi:hypothetical protein
MKSLVLCLLLATSAAGQALPSKADLREDARILREALETIHPGLYRYNTPAELAKHFAAFETEFTTAPDLPRAYVALARLLSVIQCGHTFPNAANQSKAVTAALIANRPRAPFFFRWIDRRMMVTESKELPAGTEILAVNGVKASAILTKLLPLSRTDGANEAKRIVNLELQPEKRWQAFDVLYPLVFSNAKEWTFDVREPGKRRRTVRLAATRDEPKKVERDPSIPPWQFRIDGTVATLTMKTWATYNDKWDWEGFLQRAFDEMETRNVRDLIVDIRGNEGGTGVGNVILGHLVTRELPLDLFHRFTRYRTISPALRPYLDTWDRSFDDWGAAATPSTTRPGFYALAGKSEVIQPRTPHFGGRVFVLVGPANSSATFQFANEIRKHRLGTLVGQPTGGNRRGINGGAFYFLRLPHTKLEADLPLIGYFAEGDEPNEGLVPDVVVRPSVVGDVEMARVMALIRN